MTGRDRLTLILREKMWRGGRDLQNLTSNIFNEAGIEMGQSGDVTWDSDRLKNWVWLICPKRRTILLIMRASFPRNCLQIHREANNQSNGVNASVQTQRFNSSQSNPVPDVCVIMFPQTITKVLLQYCALLAKSFPSYCEKEKIVSTAVSPLWTHLWFRERANTLKATALCVEGINILAAAVHLCTPTSVVFSHVPPFTTFLLCLTLSRLL